MGSRSRKSGHGPPDEKPKNRFVLIDEAGNLEEYTYRKCRNTKVFPKKDRGGLPLRMTNEAVDAYSFIYEANELDLRILCEAEERLRLQRKAMTKLKLLAHHIKVVYRNKQIDAAVFEHWSKQVKSVKNQTVKWHASDKERAERECGYGRMPAR